jgi:hypothetical protein
MCLCDWLQLFRLPRATKENVAALQAALNRAARNSLSDPSTMAGAVLPGAKKENVAALQAALNTAARPLLHSVTYRMVPHSTLGVAVPTCCCCYCCYPPLVLCMYADAMQPLIALVLAHHARKQVAAHTCQHAVADAAAVPEPHWFCTYTDAYINQSIAV